VKCRPLRSHRTIPGINLPASFTGVTESASHLTTGDSFIPSEGTGQRLGVKDSYGLFIRPLGRCHTTLTFTDIIFLNFLISSIEPMGTAKVVALFDWTEVYFFSCSLPESCPCLIPKKRKSILTSWDAGSAIFIWEMV